MFIAVDSYAYFIRRGGNEQSPAGIERATNSYAFLPWQGELGALAMIRNKGNKLLHRVKVFELLASVVQL